MAERFDRYFQNAKTWPLEKRRLREMLLDHDLSEELKWRKPCYCHSGANVVILYGMKDSCGLGFFKGVLLDDPSGVLIKPGENSQAARQMRFTSVAEIDAQEPVLRALLVNAIAVEQAGLEVAFPQKHAVVFPGELLAKMAADPVFKAAFLSLTPGRQRGYNLFFTGAKHSKTRSARIEKHLPRILAGIGMHDR